MFAKEWLPYAISIGIREHEFWNMTMRSLNAHIEAYKIIQKKRDEENWILGMYIQSAVSVAVEHNLAGKKARSKYIEKPFLQQVEEQKKQENLTEEEKKKYTEQLFTRLQIMMTNHKLSHKEKNKC